MTDSSKNIRNIYSIASLHILYSTYEHHFTLMYQEFLYLHKQNHQSQVCQIINSLVNLKFEFVGLNFILVIIPFKSKEL